MKRSASQRRRAHHASAILLAVVTPLVVGCTQSLLDEINATGAASFAAAGVNVVRQVDAKRISMFAVVSANPSTEEIGGYQIEVVADPTIIRNHKTFAGAYHNHHNGLVLNFAAVQVLEGNRELGLQLIRILARIAPDYQWSHPSLGNRSITRILQGIEADDGSMQEFLQDEELQWEERTKKFGISKKAPDVPKSSRVGLPAPTAERPLSPAKPNPHR